MTNHQFTGPGRIVVMAKPDGYARLCDAGDIERIRGCWRDIIRWLTGADPDELEHGEVVATVARKAALRMPRYSAYNVAGWIEEAAGLTEAEPDDASHRPLMCIVSELLEQLGFTATGQYTGWMNRVTIELLYRDATSFGANRELLVPALLRGPVAVSYFHGGCVSS
jgi:hypothetical protein